MMAFTQVRGNARSCVLAEPLFVIPYNMYTTYASVYMLDLHVSDAGLGIVTTINLILQMLSAFVSGYLTDRMGRRKALWLYDIVSWSFATLVWAVSQNVWWFLLAAVLNGFQRIPATAWYCLLVEDTPVDKRTWVFTGLQIVSVVGGLFAPIGGILVNHLSLVPATRVMYLFACLSMSVMIYVRHLGLRETDIGLRKMTERHTFDARSEWHSYMAVVQQIVKNRRLLLLFAVYVLWNIQTTIRTTFVSVYQIDYLHIPASLISLFPAISSLSMMALLFTAVPRFREEHAARWMNAGFVLIGLANLVLVIMPEGNFAWAVVSTVLAAIGTIIANPFVESVVANAMDDEQRATMLSVLNVMILACTSPAGVIGGYTYSINPQIPMDLVMVTFVISIILVWMANRRQISEIANSYHTGLGNDG